MSIYIHRNNQRFGPYEESQIAEMLRNGQVSPDDAAIRHGATEWKKLGELVAVPTSPSAAAAAASAPVSNAPVAASAPAAAVQAAPAPKKGKMGILLGCGGVLLVGVAIAAVLGFLGWRNLNPTEMTELRPDDVHGYKLKMKTPPKGDIWGTQQSYVAMYDDGGDKSIIYLVTVYSDASAAAAAFSKDLGESCKRDTPVRFDFKKDGRVVAEGGTCGGGVYVKKEDKVAVVGGSGNVDSIVEFADNMPLTAGTTRETK